MVLNVHRNHTAYWDGEKGDNGGRGYGGGGKREIKYQSLHCHHQNNSCIKMGSNESHFNVSVGSDGQSHKTVFTNQNLFEEKGEPKRHVDVDRFYIMPHYIELHVPGCRLTY